LQDAIGTEQVYLAGFHGQNKFVYAVSVDVGDDDVIYAAGGGVLPVALRLGLGGSVVGQKQGEQEEAEDCEDVVT
jgi:hypothetical protein